MFWVAATNICTKGIQTYFGISINFNQPNVVYLRLTPVYVFEGQKSIDRYGLISLKWILVLSMCLFILQFGIPLTKGQDFYILD